MRSERKSPRANVRPPEFRQKLLNWYDENARDLPWRKDHDPYRVWVSEIMLQQTRVAAVIEHYHEFLRRFPTVQRLASARESSVLAAWSGLGYYRRARMLHAAAKLIVRQRQGEFPTTAAGWRDLPGIGRYTSAAIASIAFGEPVAVVDGNVERVLQRVRGETLAGEKIWQLADELLNRERPGDFNQAMMELGAMVCMSKCPTCLMCPVLDLCAGRGEIAGRPNATRQTKRAVHYVLDCSGETVFLVQRPRDASLMGGMWELPEIGEKQVPSTCFSTRRNDNKNQTLNSDDRERLFSVKHSITTTDYTAFVWSCEAPDGDEGKRIPLRILSKIPLTGLTRKILRRADLMV